MTDQDQAPQVVGGKFDREKIEAVLRATGELEPLERQARNQGRTFWHQTPALRNTGIHQAATAVACEFRLDVPGMSQREAVVAAEKQLTHPDHMPSRPGRKVEKNTRDQSDAEGLPLPELEASPLWGVVQGLAAKEVSLLDLLEDIGTRRSS